MAKAAKKKPSHVAQVKAGDIKFIARDLSWLSFNERVLQEAKDTKHHIADRLKFLAIFSSNLDEFYRVRVATLHKMMAVPAHKLKMHIEHNPKKLLEQIHETVEQQQRQFAELFAQVQKAMVKEGVTIKSHKDLSAIEIKQVQDIYLKNINRHITPLMIESLASIPTLEDRALYLACDLRHADISLMQTYAIINVPVQACGRFIVLPTSSKKKTTVILLEEVIALCLPLLFGQFGFNQFSASIIKLTRDAELDLDYEDNSELVHTLERAISKRKGGQTVRFSYDENIQPRFLNYLKSLLKVSKQSALSPRTGIHNVKDFMDFPREVFASSAKKWAMVDIAHPLLQQPCRIMNVLDAQDILLCTPYHSFESIIDLLREASIDPDVKSINICAYRLAKESAVIAALINAARNGKKVLVVLELRARFDEVANLKWKKVLEAEGIIVKVGRPGYKVHSKIAVIERNSFGKTKYYSMMSTGNVNEVSNKTYVDYCLLSSNIKYAQPLLSIFKQLTNERAKEFSLLVNSEYIFCSPNATKKLLQDLLQKEIQFAKKGLAARAIIKVNSLSDTQLITALVQAASQGVKIDLIVRGIFCLHISNEAWAKNIRAISIVDNYLEHGRVFYFAHGGKAKIFISSADWMVRNMHHRVETTVLIQDKTLEAKLLDILDIQLSDNVKARTMRHKLSNTFVEKQGKAIRAQMAIASYLYNQ
jgi:polyphosphate kinase